MALAPTERNVHVGAGGLPVNVMDSASSSSTRRSAVARIGVNTEADSPNAPSWHAR
jgi:hypothetical protein